MGSEKQAGRISTIADPASRLRVAVQLDNLRWPWEWTAIFGYGVIDWILARHAGLEFVQWKAEIFFFCVAVSVKFYGRARNIERLSELGQFIALWLALVAVVEIFSYTTASWNFPLRDAELARIDSAMNFNWLAWLEFIKARAWLRFILHYAYNSMIPQILALVFYFAHTGQNDRNREMFWIALLAAVVTVFISGLVPALGPHLKLVQFERDLLSIRAGQRVFELTDLNGIVTFPSYHTVLAVVFIYVSRPPCRWFVPVLVLNLLMLLAIPFAGQHYLTDMIAGAFVAAGSILTIKAVAQRRKDLPASQEAAAQQS